VVGTLSSNGLVMVSGIESERSDIYTAPFTIQTWIVMSVTLLASAASIAAVLEWKRDRWVSAPRLLTITGNTARTESICLHILTSCWPCVRRS
jgi:hypothetical protein